MIDVSAVNVFVLALAASESHVLRGHIERPRLLGLAQSTQALLKARADSRLPLPDLLRHDELIVSFCWEM